MTIAINFQTTDGVSHAFRQSDPQKIETIINSIKQPTHLLTNVLVISTSLCTSLFTGDSIARIEVTGQGEEVRNAIPHEKIQLMTFDVGVDFGDTGGGGTELLPRIDFHFLGSKQLSLWVRGAMPELKQVDKVQRLANIFNASWLYYLVGSEGFGLINIRATTRIDIYMEHLPLPHCTWRADSMYC